MRILVPGHRYALRNLKSTSESNLQFYQDGELHGEEVPGPSCQEVLRAVIDRVKTLDTEKPWAGNAEIIQKGREMIALFESRALQLKAARGDPIEYYVPGDDGHLV